MATENTNDLIVQNTILADGYPHSPALDPIVYSDVYAPAGMDLSIDADTADTSFDLAHFGTIKRLLLKARSGTIFYKLNGTGERYTLNSFAILSFAPTSILFDNDHETEDGLVEIVPIGDNS